MGVQLPSEPITRKEQYLAKAAGQAVEIPAEPITREEAYLDAIAKGSGGGGGTSDYPQLTNKPQINGTTLVGNKTASQLGLASTADLAGKVDKVEGKGLSTNDYTDAEKAIVGGVTSALQGKVDKVDGYGLSENNYTNADKIIVGGVTTALTGKVDKVEGKGLSENDYTDSDKAIVDGVTAAIALKQDKTDNSLDTEAKTIVGAINEHEGDVSTLKSGLTTLDSEVNGDATTYPYADVITIEDAVPANVADCSVKIEPVQSGSGDPSPTNIRPITGHTEASVQRTGRNLWHRTFVDDGFNQYDTYSQYCNRAGNVETPVIVGQKYTFSIDGVSKQMRYVILDANKNEISGYTNAFTTITMPSNAKYLKWRSLDDVGSQDVKAQLEIGETVHAYVPYVSPQTYTISLGDTIYGGTVNFKTGKVRVTHRYFKITNDTTISANSSGWNVYHNSYYFNIAPNGITDSLKATCISNVMHAVNRNQIQSIDETYACAVAGGGNEIDFTSDIDTISDVKQFLLDNDTEFVYELATPITIQLTPQQLQLLKGQNTLTASTGDISVTVNGVSGSIGSVQEQVNELDDNKVGFVKIAQPIKTLTDATESYTVPCDCYMNAFLKSSTGYTAYIKVGNTEIISVSNSTDPDGRYITLPLKKGSVITMREGQDYSYRILFYEIA